MTQHPKHLCTPVLRVCKQTTSETLPILYGGPEWRAGCRFEALASQISISNFSLIKHMCVDADDLPSIVGSLLLDVQERDPGYRVGTFLAVEQKLELESRALLENTILSDASAPTKPSAGMAVPWTSMQRLKFANLEVLQVEGYQTMALSSRGNRKSRLEGLRLCKFAKEILAYHPSLAVLVQQDPSGNGGSDAVDMGMGRVRWRFLRHEGCKAANEHVADLSALEKALKAMVEIDEEGALGRQQQQQHTVPAWGQGGTFQQYPYLHLPFVGARPV